MKYICFLFVSVFIFFHTAMVLLAGSSYAAELPYHLPLSKEELDYLKENKTFYYAIEVKYAPIEYLGSDGKPKGFGVEYLQKAGALLGVEFLPIANLEDYTWDELLDAIKENKIDILPTTTLTEERLAYMDFTKPYLKTNTIVAGHDSERLVLQVNDMKGCNIVLPKGYWHNDYLISQLDDINIINTVNVIDTLDLLNRKKADYTVLEGTVYSFYRKEKAFKNIKIMGELDIATEHRIAVAKDHTMLRDILDKVIDIIPKTEAYSNALIIYTPSETNEKLVLLVICISIFCIVIICRQFKKNIESRRYRLQMQKDRQHLIENLSHDLKTPLATLKTNLKLLTTGLVKNEQEKHYHILDKNVDRLNNIIDVLYETTHIQEDVAHKNMIIVDLHHFMHEVYDLHKNIFASSVRKLVLISDKDNKSIKVKLDVNSMHRVFSNLLSNTLKFTDENSEIVMAFTKTGNKAILSVTDHGMGIGKKDMKNIFKRFYKSTLSKNTGGKGLGLSIAKEIVECHGGNIKVESVKGIHTTFTITLNAID